MSEHTAENGPEGRVPDLDTFMRLIARSPDRDRLADPQALERQLFARLAEHDDPMWREVGQQLRGGQMDVRRVAEVGAYWDHLLSELVRQRDSFHRAVAATREALEAAEAERSGQDERPS